MKKKQTHQAMFLLTTDLSSGSQRLRALLAERLQAEKIVATSSIYKRQADDSRLELSSDLLVVLKVETELDPNEIFENFYRHKQEANENNQDQLILLAYEKMVRMAPGQNLPHPLLHADDLTLRCAAEVWGDYEHPVLGQTLQQLVRSRQDLPVAEFFAQGKSLFSSESI